MELRKGLLADEYVLHLTANKNKKKYISITDHQIICLQTKGLLNSGTRGVIDSIGKKLILKSCWE